jgi:hypothetical protein
VNKNVFIERRGINLIDLENPEKGASMDHSDFKVLTNTLHKLWKERGLKIKIDYIEMPLSEVATR